MSVDDDLDALYGVPPEEFTALRNELAAAAKKRGDGDAAKVIAAARRPTLAAWVINRLVRADDTVRSRLGALTAELRSAHAEMDGLRIRELTGVQRKLIAELVRASLAASGLSDPPAAIREDITGTLQAAIADPEVAGRLGRLEKAEKFSGFGDFGAVSAEAATTKTATTKTAPTKTASAKTAAKPIAKPKVSADQLRAARKHRDAAAKAETSARKAAAEAADELKDAKSRAATALRRYEKILQTLSAAEREMNSATTEMESAEQTVSEAVESADSAAAELAEAERALADLTD